MTLLDYLPLLIMPFAGLVIIAVMWVIIAVDRRKEARPHTPAE